MGILSVDKALSEGTIKKSIVETGVVDDVIGEALRENTVSMGGAYGELVQSVMKTDVMNDFFAAYLSSVIRSEVYGEQYAGDKNQLYERNRQYLRIGRG